MDPLHLFKVKQAFIPSLLLLVMFLLRVQNQISEAFGMFRAT